MERTEAVEALRTLALIAELLDDEDARASALRRAARAVAAMPPQRWQAWLAGQAAPAIAPEVEEQLRALATPGLATRIEAQLLRIPPGILEMLELPALGPRRVRRLWREAGIVTPQQVHRAAERGRLARILGFGPRLQQRILEELRRRHQAQGRWTRHQALAAAAARECLIRRLRDLTALEPAGELRRALETVTRIVWVAAAADPDRALGRLLAAGGDAGADRTDCARFVHADEPPQDVIVVEPARFPARLFLETGAPAHVNGMLELLTPLWGDGWLPRDEAEIYARAGCAFVPPELREGRGEIAAARAGGLPRLIEFADLRGVFHCHTDWSDGRATILELAEGARRLGWDYIGIADHSQAAFYARGLDGARLAAQAQAIASAQREVPDVRIFHGVECDIEPDGALDLPPEVLARLDYVIASVHSLPRMGRAAMTARVLRALQDPATAFLAHPSGRLLLEREASALDWEPVFDAALAHGVCLEFNTSPARLDLDWRLIRAATERGIRIVVNPDAHRLDMLERVEPALATARKGWLTRAQVFNTASVAEVEEAFHARRSRGPHGH
jgi:DNA polymerase (family X)